MNKNIFKWIIVVIAILAIIIGIMMMTIAPIAGNLVLSSGLAYADIKAELQEGVKEAGGDDDTMELGDIINRVINVLLFLVGALSVVFIIVAGIYFSISNGNAEQVKRAKNTMTYAVIGLIVSILSYAIVNFVITIF